MTSKIILTFLIVSMTLWNASCKPGNDEPSPKMAKSVLAVKGYKFNDSEFFRALKAENAMVVGGFLQAGINPNAKNAKGETALTHSLLSVESTVILKALIKKADLNMRDDLGNSPIHLALRKGNDTIINILLKKNIDVNLTGQRRGYTKNVSALFVAVILKRTDLVEKLLKKDADPNIADSAGSLPLAEAAFQRTANPEIVKMLLENGADVNKTEKNGTTPLIYAASNGDLTSETRLKIVRMLLEKGADKSIKNKEGETALYWAKKLKYDSLAALLK